MVRSHTFVVCLVKFVSLLNAVLSIVFMGNILLIEHCFFFSDCRWLLFLAALADYYSDDNNKEDTSGNDD